MGNPLEIIEEKIELAISRIEKLTQENTELRAEVSNLRQNLEKMNRQDKDRSNIVKSKLASVLNRIGQLEALNN